LKQKQRRRCRRRLKFRRTRCTTIQLPPPITPPAAEEAATPPLPLLRPRLEPLQQPRNFIARPKRGLPPILPMRPDVAPLTKDTGVRGIRRRMAPVSIPTRSFALHISTNSRHGRIRSMEKKTAQESTVEAIGIQTINFTTSTMKAMMQVTAVGTTVEITRGSLHRLQYFVGVHLTTPMADQAAVELRLIGTGGNLEARTDQFSNA